MKYVPPYGRESEGDSASYVNGNPATGQQGSIPPAEAFEHPMRELVAVIEKSKFIPDDEDLLQAAKGIRSQGLNFAEDTGSVNVLSVAFDPPIAAYTLGLLIRVRVNATNTGGATIDAGAGRVAIRRSDGVPVSAGDLPGGALIDLAWDGIAFQMLNFLGAGGTGSITIEQQNIPFCVDSSATPNVVTAPFSPAITSVFAGLLVEVTIANTNTGPTTITVNALPPTAIVARGATGGVSALLPGDINVGDTVVLSFDGTNWQVTPNILIPASATINVPSQYATVTALMNALARKRIAAQATLTVQLASGVYQPFAVSHSDGNRIVVKGTMIGTTPILTDIVRTGATQAARANDINSNLPMLRTKYGTEIAIVRARDMALFVAGKACGITNTGGGMPTVQDILITGGRTPGELGGGALDGTGATPMALDEVGIYVGQSGSLMASNVATALCGTGFMGEANSDLVCANCLALGNSYGGFYSFRNGVVDVGYGWAFGNGYLGFTCTDSSHLGVYTNSQSGRNQYFGMTAVNTANAGAIGSNFTLNGTTDISIAIGSKVGLQSPMTVGTTSPALNVIGNTNSVIVTNY